MLSFRQKLFLSYLVVFLAFLAVLFPFAAKAVRTVVKTTLSNRTTQVIRVVETEPDLGDLLRRLEEESPNFFFRVSLLEPSGKILYDSHREELVESDYSRYLEDHPEIGEAAKEGIGYNEGYSFALGKRLVYVARAFDFHGQLLIIRTSFPLTQVNEFTDQFERGFFTLGFIVLLLFSIMTTIIAHHLSRPIRRITDAIRPYQEGREEHLPAIALGVGGKRTDDFQRLADTLNKLNARIEAQMATLKSERQEREAILEALVEGVIAVDNNLAVTFANQTALQMLDREEKELLGQPLSAAGYKEFHELLVDTESQGEMLASTSELGEKRKIYLDVIAAPKEEGAVLVLQDKSIHYRILEMRKDFIANASHELKTPITIIRGFAETLHEHAAIPRETIELVTGKIISNCERMESLIRNFLRLADIENLPRGNLELCNLYDLALTCKGLTLAVYEDAQIRIHQEHKEAISVFADAELLQLAVTNLLDNAAKYSNGVAQIDLSIDILPGEEMAKITVSDQGLGIPPEDLDKIFDRFYTVDKAHSRQMGGSGLGLSIVRTIIEKHFGKIRVESTLGEGTTFTILLPLSI